MCIFFPRVSCELSMNHFSNGECHTIMSTCCTYNLSKDNKVFLCKVIVTHRPASTEMAPTGGLASWLSILCMYDISAHAYMKGLL